MTTPILEQTGAVLQHHYLSTPHSPHHHTIPATRPSDLPRFPWFAGVGRELERRIRWPHSTWSETMHLQVHAGAFPDPELRTGVQ